MPVNPDLKKVMVIGSGPIVIGQAAEFDYAGTQACKSLREEGLEVVLVNSNPATIMTDENIADRVYLEPLTLASLTRVIARERPQGLLPTLGGQTGLNLAVELARAGVLDRYGVRLLGTALEAIQRSEDRELFKQTMQQLGEPIPESTIASSVPEALAFAAEIGYPVIVRPAYTLGGTGGGIAHHERELAEVAKRGLMASLIGQVLVERSVAGWKEIEYEVMRDAADNCITICNMENLDPIGIHTGDSLVVAPSQTLSDKEYQMLRSASLRIIRALGVEGGCNVQFALDPHSFGYYVIEVNPRVSRSSALASKATGYPIAKVAAKIAVGLTLAEIQNPVTRQTSACFEPALDYLVLKIPRWPFDKFAAGDRVLGTQMKATGEVMAIDRTFEAALLKAVRSLETGVWGLRLPDSLLWSEMELEDRLAHADDERLFVIAEAFRRHWTVTEVAQITAIDRFFLEKIRCLVEHEEQLLQGPLTPELLMTTKKLGFSDYQIAKLVGVSTQTIRDKRLELGIVPVYKIVDTCAAEFEAATPYYYSTFEEENEACSSGNRRVLVIGSGPIRIGQGIEFDYCSVHSVWALREAGVESIIINNNPETVSTDFDTSDRLYFEPLNLEDVLNVIDQEKPEGVIVQFGGQTAINLAHGLEEHGVKVLGTSVASIDAAEDRKKFEELLAKLGIPQSEGRTVTSVPEALVAAGELGFPVLVRPSYVIGGRAMEVVSNEEDLAAYMAGAVKVSPKHPVLVDKYIPGKEVEVDAISDGYATLIPGIMEHLERAGVHSGDSMAVFPPQTLSEAEVTQIVDYTCRIAKALEVKGLLNVQYVVSGGRVYVLEVNPRASRTVPILSKVTGVPMVKVATQVMLGQTLAGLGYRDGLWPEPNHIIVKAPVFSFEKLAQVEVSLGPEMKSTGEVMGLDPTYHGALLKALQGSGLGVKSGGRLLVSVADRDKTEVLAVARRYLDLGFELLARGRTGESLKQAGMAVTSWQVGGEESLGEVLRREGITLVINTPTRGRLSKRAGFQLRRAAIECGIPCLTSLDTAMALAEAMEAQAAGGDTTCCSLQEYLVEQQGATSPLAPREAAQ